MVSTLASIYFSLRLGWTIKANCTKFQTVDPDISSILILKRIQDSFLNHDFVLTDKISLPLLLEILDNMCIVIICFPVCTPIQESNSKYQSRICIGLGTAAFFLIIGVDDKDLFSDLTMDLLVYLRTRKSVQVNSEIKITVYFIILFNTFSIAITMIKQPQWFCKHPLHERSSCDKNESLT